MPSATIFALALAASSVLAAPAKRANAIWQPTPGTKWQIILDQACNVQQQTAAVTADVYDIDLFVNDASVISGLHAAGKKVVCYFSAGSYEPDRPDSDQFQSADLGSVMDGWPDEKWLNVNNANVRNIMKARIELAAKNGCDGVDPDNVDGYDNSNGLGLTQQNAADFVNFMADTAAANNLAIGLKNAGGLINDVIGKMQFSVNEQCHEYSECKDFQPFITANKPVFNIEYPGSVSGYGAASASNAKCNSASTDSAGFSTVMKNLDLDTAVNACPESPGYSGAPGSSSSAPAPKPSTSAAPTSAPSTYAPAPYPTTTKAPAPPAPSSTQQPTSANPVPSPSTSSAASPSAPSSYSNPEAPSQSSPTPSPSSSASPSQTAAPTGTLPGPTYAPSGTAPAKPSSTTKAHKHKGHKNKGDTGDDSTGTDQSASTGADDECKTSYVEVYDL